MHGAERRPVGLRRRGVSADELGCGGMDGAAERFDLAGVDERVVVRVGQALRWARRALRRGAATSMARHGVRWMESWGYRRMLVLSGLIRRIAIRDEVGAARAVRFRSRALHHKLAGRGGSIISRDAGHWPADD